MAHELPWSEGHAIQSGHNEQRQQRHHQNRPQSPYKPGCAVAFVIRFACGHIGRGGSIADWNRRTGYVRRIVERVSDACGEVACQSVPVRSCRSFDAS